MNEKKWCLITGSSNGFGRILAICLAKNGYNIIIHGRNKKRLKSVSGEIKSIGSEFKIIRSDLNKIQSIKDIIKIIEEKNIKIVINNAAEYKFGKLIEHSDLDIEKIIKTNLIVPILITKYVINFYLKNGGGIIININTVAGKIGNENESIYCSSKFGLRGFSESIKHQLIKENIKIIDVYPGAMSIGMSTKRGDLNLLIDPVEVSDFIIKTLNNESFIINDINLQRTHYKI